VTGRTAASWLRSKLWGAVFAVTSDGLSVQGSLPPGPCVLVANHGSHADTAALIAAFGRHRPLVAVAAADYWLSSPVRRVAAGTLAGIVPIVRDQVRGRDHAEVRDHARVRECVAHDPAPGTEPAPDPLAAAAAALAAGSCVVLFPEGTRSEDGRLGRFRTGAFRLAARAQVPVVPVGLAGTRAILPKHGRLTRVPVAVRVGEPLTPPADPDDVAAIRALADRAAERVEELAAGPAQPVPGRTWQRLTRWAAGWPGLALVGCWAFAEAISWPLLAEFPLIGLMVVARRRAARLVAATVLASGLGILVTWWLARHGVLPPSPLTSARMRAVAAEQLAADPASAFWAQSHNGIPVKVYARQAGLLDVPLPVLLAGLWPRVLRIVAVGTVAGLLGRALQRYLAPCLGAAVAAASLVGPLAVWELFRLWS
jgi:1-acyl-sn-glycerol-3-phosphate acyltransferase/membrane protein YqaA with SNARE-associated domain